MDTDTTPQTQETPRRSNGFRSTIAFKALLLAVLCLLAAIPLAWIHGLQSEREDRQSEAQAELGRQWGNAQSLVGPLLVVPARYDEVIKEKVWIKGVETLREKTITRRVTVCVFPDRYDLESRIEPDWLYRGIFRLPVYRSRVAVEGNWSQPDLLKLGYPKAEFEWDKGRILFKLSDPRGLRVAKSKVDDLGREAQPSTGGPFQGEWVALGEEGFDQAPQAFSLQLELRGSRFFGFLPLGKEGKAKITSSWADPSFTGYALPEQRSVGEDGFEASYAFSEFGSGIPQSWVEQEGRSLEPKFEQCISGVELLDPVNSYRLVDRSLKYGLLFVGAVFGVFFLFEILCRLALHPMQYVLAGSGILAFFLLLLSLSEVISFGWAYLVASVASVVLVGLYARAALRRSRNSLTFGATMSVLLGFLYVILQQQDYALLVGAVFVFLTLALVMYLTRWFDWGSSTGIRA